MNPEDLERLRIAYLDPRMAVRSDPSSGALTLRAYKSIEDIPLSEDFIDINDYKDALGEEGVSFLLDFVDKVQAAPDPYAVFAKNLPENIQELAPGAVEMFKIELNSSSAQAMNSHTYAFANTVQIWPMADFVAVVNVANKTPQLIMAAPKNTQNAKLVWAVGFGIELLLGVLSILGVPKLSNSKVAEFLQKILSNPAMKEAFNRLTAGVTGAAVGAFITKLYEEGLLGALMEEALIGAGWATIAYMLTLIAAKFFSGGTLLAVHSAIIATELGIKIARKP